MPYDLSFVEALPWAFCIVCFLLTGACAVGFAREWLLERRASGGFLAGRQADRDEAQP